MKESWCVGYGDNAVRFGFLRRVRRGGNFFATARRGVFVPLCSRTFPCSKIKSRYAKKFSEKRYRRVASKKIPLLRLGAVAVFFVEKSLRPQR